MRAELGLHRLGVGLAPPRLWIRPTKFEGVVLAQLFHVKHKTP